eukprot:TRINITY_DN16454_c0_g1_i2.p1 TRINITY_DN16454_c0_g1~~TRINITY_DN16454_c0_g1_i2.p1  ORF type:complete len:153 (+),score=26.48 TRINITY_DN16454_c0_g1_i2:99-557(+)
MPGDEKTDIGEVPVGDLVPITAYCCCIGSCYCTWPECIGCVSEGTFLCCVESMTACKPVKQGENNPNKVCCLCARSDIYLKPPDTCVACKGHTCCIDERCAMPCNEDVPCLCTFLGLTCCYKWKCHVACCHKISQMEEAVGESVKPAQEEMQ